MQEQLCQSCGMPMGETDELYGTNADGSKSVDYCNYCYKDGSFTSDIPMSEMIDQWVTYMVKENPALTEEDARKEMGALISTLKRWNS